MRRLSGAVNPARNPEPSDFVPLPNLPYNILVVLAEEDRHGWAILKRIEELGERSLPSAGSFYLALARLEERGLIEAIAQDSEGDTRRRVFRLTALGRRVVKLESARLAGLVAIARRALGSLET